MNEKQPRRKKKSGPRENLSLFGEWFYTLIDNYLYCTIEDIAEHTGIHVSTISRFTRENPESKTTVPSVETIQKLSNAMQVIAKERGIIWQPLLETRLMHAARHATKQDVQETRESLNVFRQMLLGAQQQKNEEK